MSVLSSSGINFFSVENPIRIDQNYCDQKGGAVCDPDDVRQRQQRFVDLAIRRTTANCVYVHACMQPSAVEVSNVAFNDWRGSSAKSSGVAIRLGCSAGVPRRSIVVNDVEIRSEDGKSEASTECENGKGTNCPTRTPPIDCLTPEDDDLIASAQQQPPPTLLRSTLGT